MKLNQVEAGKRVEISSGFTRLNGEFPPIKGRIVDPKPEIRDRKYYVLVQLEGRSSPEYKCINILKEID